MAAKSFVYFVTLSSNVPFVIRETLSIAAKGNQAAVYFDLDGARVLDHRFLREMDRTHASDVYALLMQALEAGVELYGCQMNVLIADGLELIEGVELAGVASFLEKAYQADAVFSY